MSNPIRWFRLRRADKRVRVTRAAYFTHPSKENRDAFINAIFDEGQIRFAKVLRKLGDA